jgi:hypothetical protein
VTLLSILLSKKEGKGLVLTLNSSSARSSRYKFALRERLQETPESHFQNSGDMSPGIIGKLQVILSFDIRICFGFGLDMTFVQANQKRRRGYVARAERFQPLPVAVLRK